MPPGVLCAVPPVTNALPPSRRRDRARDIAQTGRQITYKGAVESEAGFLRRRRVGAAGRQKYARSASLFRQFCVQQKLPLSDTSEVDSALDMYIVHLSTQKASLQEGREAFYSVRYTFDLQSFHLPLAHASLDGYKREDPDISRDPCPWEVACLAALQVLEMPDPLAPLAAAAILLCFDGYSRPGALCGLMCESLISLDQQRWCLIFFPANREERSKSRTQDDTIEIGVHGREWLRGVAKALDKVRRGPSKLFGVSLPVFQRFFAQGLLRSGLKKLGYTPHCLRHGGASANAHAGIDVCGIQLR